jgi:hypothetical protein
VRLKGGGAYLHGRVSAADATANAAIAAAAEARQLIDQQVARAAERSERATADALTSAARAERLVAIMAAPDARRLELLGSRAAPAAVGQAIWSRSHGVIITAMHMPWPEPGRTYQVWLGTSHGTLSLGFASPDAQGRIAVTFDLPPDLPGTVTGFVVSPEPLGGSATPTKPVILSG